MPTVTISCSPFVSQDFFVVFVEIVLGGGKRKLGKVCGTDIFQDPFFNFFLFEKKEKDRRGKVTFMEGLQNCVQVWFHVESTSE